MTARDPRLHAYRPDLADERLRGEVDAARFVRGRAARVAVAVADIRKAPHADAGLSTQALCGDDVSVFDIADGWAWIQADADGYVGYVADAAIAEPDRPPTHVVVVPRTFLYPGPDLKRPRTGGCRWVRGSRSPPPPRPAAVIRSWRRRCVEASGALERSPSYVAVMRR